MIEGRIKLKAFLEGIEIPVLGAHITLAVGRHVECNLYVLPTNNLLMLKPRTKLHLFYWDDYVAYPKGNTASRGSYVLLFEGEMIAVGYSHSTNQMTGSIQFQGLTNHLEYVTLGMQKLLSFDEPGSIQQLTASTSTALAVTDQDYIFKKFADTIANENYNIFKVYVPTLYPEPDSEVGYEYYKHVGTNWKLHDETYRYVALNMGYVSRIYGQLLEAKTSVPGGTALQQYATYIQNQLFQVANSGTMWDLVQLLLRIGFCNLIPITGVSKRSLASIPVLYGSPPPLCNTIFPNDNMQINLTMAKTKEPTRIMILNGDMNSFSVQSRAQNSQLGGFDAIGHAEFAFLLKVKGEKTAYVEETNLAYRKDLSKLEIERAPYLITDRFNDVMYSATAAQTGKTANQFASQYADYRIWEETYNTRTCSVITPSFQPNLVVGLPCLVSRKIGYDQKNDKPIYEGLIGDITSITHVIDCRSGATTSVGLNKVWSLKEKNWPNNSETPPQPPWFADNDPFMSIKTIGQNFYAKLFGDQCVSMYDKGPGIVTGFDNIMNGYAKARDKKEYTREFTKRQLETLQEYCSVNNMNLKINSDVMLAQDSDIFSMPMTLEGELFSKDPDTEKRDIVKQIVQEYIDNKAFLG